MIERQLDMGAGAEPTFKLEAGFLAEQYQMQKKLITEAVEEVAKKAKKSGSPCSGMRKTRPRNKYEKAGAPLLFHIFIYFVPLHPVQMLHAGTGRPEPFLLHRQRWIL